MYNINGVLDRRERLEISQQKYISQLKDFCIWQLEVWKHIRVTL